MIVPGEKSGQPASSGQIAEMTVKALRQYVQQRCQELFFCLVGKVKKMRL